MVPAVQPGLERRRGQPAEPGRAQDRLPLEARSSRRAGLTDILENYAQVVEEKDAKTGKKKRDADLPALPPARRRAQAAGRRRAARRGQALPDPALGRQRQVELDRLARAPADRPRSTTARRSFDSIIVVTDRRILDQQIRDTIKQFAQVGATVGHAEHSGDLRKFIEDGKKIIISTVQKFPFILDEIGDEHRGRRFAIIIDEAHSSQGGRDVGGAERWRSSAAGADEDDETVEDTINRLMEARRCCRTPATSPSPPRPRTRRWRSSASRIDDGRRRSKHRPFHSYTMKQAIQEGFILDVLKNYTPVDSYYKLVKTVEDDPEFDTKRAQKKLRRYVESHDHAIRLKAEIMVDHFHEQVLGAEQDRRPGAGDGGDQRHRAGDPVLPRDQRLPAASARARTRRSSPSRASTSTAACKVTEASLNGFPSSEIADKIQEDPYRFLICADKFQTGYDEPLLHTMYVDKLALGHQGGADAVAAEPRAPAEARRLRARLHERRRHDRAGVRRLLPHDDPQRGDRPEQAARPEGRPRRLPGLRRRRRSTSFVALYLGGADRDQLDPILDACVAIYSERARRGRPGRLQGQGQGVRAHLRLPRLDPARTPTPSGRSSRSS